MSGDILHPAERAKLFTVTKVQLRKQVAEGSASEDDHLIWLDDSMQVLTEDGPRLPAQTLWFIDTDQWVDDLYVTCGKPGCIKVEHLTTDPKAAQAAKDARDLALVQKSAVTLADLYRRGKAKGLLKPGSPYGG